MRGPVEGEFLPFGWSHSRQRVLDQCARRYYYTYYVARQGRRSGIGEEAWLAAALKRLTTFELVLGTAVHDRAAEILAAVRSRKARPDLELLVQRTRGALNRLYTSSLDRTGFLYSSDRREMLLAYYYGREVSEERIDALREKMHRCLTNLHSCSLWEELERDPSRILAVDRICEFELEGTLVYVAPDVIYRTAQGEIVVGDWKTGRCDGARDQLALYCLYAQTYLGVNPPDGMYHGRVFGLSDGRVEEHSLSQLDLEAAADRVRNGVREMRSYMADPEQNQPRDKDAFAVTARRTRCSRCNYFELCSPELRHVLTPKHQAVVDSPAVENPARHSRSYSRREQQ